MGAKGMSVQGGMFLFCNEHGILQQHFIDLVYEQSSNQSLEEAMSGLAAQLDFIRRQYPNIETIFIVSDKCSNFNSFEQIPFLIAGNQRHWVLPDRLPEQEENIVPIYTAPTNTRRKLQVAKWIFTEAQLGRDQLDCHFAWITNCFAAYLQGEGNNLMHPRDMFTALTHPSYDIVNTHVLYGSTAHPSLQIKFSMKYVKVHQVHEYSYTALARGKQKVEVAYHGGILTPHHRTTEAFTTSDADYVQWIHDSNFEALPWKIVRIHGCRQKKLTVNKSKVLVEDATLGAGKKGSSESVRIPKRYRTLCTRLGKH
jgi:hypothetical protein